MHISSAMPKVARNDLTARFDATAESVVRPAVRDLLERSPAFAALSADRQRALAADMVSVAAYLAEPADLASQAKDFVRAVDFPAFVAGLIHGVFDAIVDASIQQMEAYSELVKAVADSIDDFVSDNVSDNQARDYLTQNYPDLVPPEHRADATEPPEPPCRRQLVAAAMTAGIGKIMGTA